MVKSVEKEWLSGAEAKKYLDCSDEFLKKLRDNALVGFSNYKQKYWYELASIRKFLLKRKVV